MIQKYGPPPKFLVPRVVIIPRFHCINIAASTVTEISAVTEQNISAETS